MAEREGRAAAAAADVAAAVAPGEALILADQDELEGRVSAGRRTWPFPEADGAYAGPPEDDRAAVAELERLRGQGARFFAVAWPAFWWLDYYAGFHRHLHARYRCVLRNDRLVLFDLQGPAPGEGPGGEAVRIPTAVSD
jgi:hypothetical protein